MNASTRHLVSKYSALAVSMLALIWAAVSWTQPGLPWEALITFVGSFVTFVTLSASDERERLDPVQREAHRRSDKELFDRFLELLPTEGPIAFARNQDFLASFRHEAVQPFNEFSDSRDNPEHEFHDSELEARRVDFV